MDCINYLKNEQPIAYQTFLNSFKNNRVFHAYLLSGEIGTPLLDIAKFIAKSLLCLSPNPFACDKCNNCKRVDDETYGDLIIIDGKRNNIYKEDIQKIETEFSKTSLERKGIKVYIINLVENMMPDSVNALLKFLEEPSESTYAILTTENEFRVLPTILSRTQIIHLNLIDKATLIQFSAQDGVKKEDAELLCNFYNDAASIKTEAIDPDFLSSKEMVTNIFSKIDNANDLRFYIENDVCSKLNSKPAIRFFFDMLIFFFKESYVYSIEKKSIFESYIPTFNKIIKRYKDLDIKVIKLMDLRNELNFNINNDLLIMHVLNSIFE
ncbi:MAG: DNA polymerase III subunit [Bacilli bacterium]